MHWSQSLQVQTLKKINCSSQPVFGCIQQMQSSNGAENGALRQFVDVVQRIANPSVCAPENYNNSVQ